MIWHEGKVKIIKVQISREESFVRHEILNVLVVSILKGNDR